MLRIFMTGDNHIGKQYSNHSAKDKIISERINALSRMAAKANEENCDLFAVTGDLFERTARIPDKQIKAVIDAFSGFNGQVIVLPGNHDYYDDNVEVWKKFKKFSKGKEIILMTEYKPYKIPVGNDTAVIYPAFCDKLHSNSGENKLDWIKALDIPDDGNYHIGMAHGAVIGESLDSEGAYFQMSREELLKIPVDVWLIGHTHVPFPDNLSESFSKTDERIFNAGSHVQTDVNNNTEGLCFILEIDENKKIKAKKYLSGDLRFYRGEITLKTSDIKAELTEELKAFNDNTVLDLTLSGSVTAEEYDNRAKTIDCVLKRFIEAEYDDKITKLITKEVIDREFPETGFASQFLNALLGDSKEAQLAYDLINEIKEGK